MVSKGAGTEIGSAASNHPGKETADNWADSERGVALPNGTSTKMTPPTGSAGTAANGTETNIDASQDTFHIKVQLPGSDIIDLQLPPQEMVQEIARVLMEREDTCHRTCFSIQHDGNILDNFAELASIEGLKDGSVFRVVEEPYTIREARLHIRHIQDLLKSLDLGDAYNGIECNSLSFLSSFSEGDIGETSTSGKRKRRSVSDQPLDTVECSPPECILPGAKDRPLSLLQPMTMDNKHLQCLKSLMMNGWNPPPGNRKMRGDLMYLNVITMEDRHISITASTRGFFINQSTAVEFNPKPDNPNNPNLLCHSLVDLLNQISPIFKKNFAALQKKRTNSHPFTRLATPLQTYSWIIPHKPHTIDFVRAENVYTSPICHEEHISGQIRDWNEELQITREMPSQNPMQQLMKEQTIFKVSSDFVAAAISGAMAVVDGSIIAINPGEYIKMQMFVWNNIFFSFGFDIRENFKESGGDHAAYAASSSDLKGIQAYSDVNVEGLHLLGTVIVDYRGYRVVAQSIIPGILEQEQEQNVVYGSIDFGKDVTSHHEYVGLLIKTSKPLRIQKHMILNEMDQPIMLCSSVDCKGIVGNDGRRYFLDLFRTFPPDLNYLPIAGEELHGECQRLGFPKEYRHKLCSVRPELVENFVQYKNIQFSELLKEKMRRRKSLMEDGEGTTETNDYISDAEVLKATCQEVGSINEGIFDIRFNLNVYAPDVRFPECELESLKVQKRLMKDIADFVVSVQIPSFIKDCEGHVLMPADGATMTDALHKYGINIRYIGKITQLISQSENKQYLEHISRLLIGEIITRVAKHVVVLYQQNVEISALSLAISHFLNCFLSSHNNGAAHLLPGELASRKKRNKRKMRIPENDLAWASLTRTELWKQINSEAFESFDYALACDGVDQAVDKFNLQKVSLLREFCLKAGIQILLRDYNFDNRHKPTFTEDDILNTFPVFKHIIVKSKDAERVYQRAQMNIQKGNIKNGFELLKESLNLFKNVFGPLHLDVCACLHMLAQLNYIIDDIPEAIKNQQKAVIISERILGFDHPNTIREYVRLGLYCFANNQNATALRLLYRARQLMLTVCGEDHPEVAVLDINIGLVLQTALDYDLAIRFLQKGLELNIKYSGPQALQTALSYHLLAQVNASKADFRAAMQHEKQAYIIYRDRLGETHLKTKGSSEFLKHFTQQAVNLQRTMNEIYKNGSNANLSPVQTTSQSKKMTLDQLNIINGIVLMETRKSALEKATEQMRNLILEEIHASQRLTKSLVGNGVDDQILVNGSEASREIVHNAEKTLINDEAETGCVASKVSV
ncbi:clustered mitochondria protein homolog isoform X1 [Leucoraja erinacea]|uniref:clustered mitochondria protein homolog isoform X1 n=2 Tax=Leucoraja erinaceus TaxID=7782 RepID=UPI002456C0AA|nr:clustered mitochondria protein homolog isoform X1 [Leucoraja erinacea]